MLAVRGNFFGTISYLYCCTEKNCCAVVDASGHAAYLMKHAEQRGMKIVALLQTHAHLDHVGAGASLGARRGGVVSGAAGSFRTRVGPRSRRCPSTAQNYS